MTDTEANKAYDGKIWLTLISIILIFVALIFYARHLNLERQKEAQATLVSRYTNYQYEVKLQFPPGWAPLRDYSYDRYEGADGFFGISAGGTEEIGIDEMARNEAEHALRPYGSEPQIDSLKVDGQDARLIMPSEDQDPSMKGQAALIIKYPEPITVSSERYSYFIFWADKEHIRDLSSSIAFIREP